MSSNTTVSAVREVLADYDVGGLGEIAPLGNGLINDTFAVETATGPMVCQRVHPVFAPEIHQNIAAVTEHLASKNVATPSLLRTRDGSTHVVRDGRVWRLMTRLAGVSFDAAHGLKQVEAAGRVLAGFHSALADLEHQFVGVRSGVHDTARHLATLAAAVSAHVDHRLFSAVEPLATLILEAGERLPDDSGLPTRCMHGDPKFNNILFEGALGDAALHPVGLIDLDTVAPLELHLELGDAWRSWCNPKGEDDGDAHFDLGTYEASLRGWAGAVSFDLEAAEKEALTIGVERITVELAARFCADALAESYFGWDATRFESRGAHNLVRARGQWALHGAVLGCRDQRRALLHDAL